MALLNPDAFLEEVLVGPGGTARAVATTLLSAGAIIIDHVVLASMAHAGIYFNVKELFSGRHPQKLAYIASFIAHACWMHQIEVVVGPETGGSRLAEAVAVALRSMFGNPPTMAVGARKTGAIKGPKFYFPQEAQSSIRRRRVLLVEDVITTGGSMADVANLISMTGGTIVSSIVVVDRTPFDHLMLEEKIGFPTTGLMKVFVPTFPENTPCPMCEAGIPVRADLGRGKVFLEQQTKKS